MLIAVAGRSNGLGPVLSGNSVLPVINCPPLKSDNIERSVWSSLDVPSGIANNYIRTIALGFRKLKSNILTGLGCTTVVHPEGAAFAAAQIHAMRNHIVWARLRAKQLGNFISLKRANFELQ